jgi:hypothetical protein
MGPLEDSVELSMESGVLQPLLVFDARRLLRLFTLLIQSTPNRPA